MISDDLKWDKNTEYMVKKRFFKNGITKKGS